MIPYISRYETTTKPSHYQNQLAMPALILEKVDGRHIFEYHSPMTNDDTNTSEPNPLTIGELISLDAAAAYAGLTRKSLRNYALKGRLKAKKLGSQWVTTRAAIDEYIASRSLENIPHKYRQTP